MSGVSSLPTIDALTDEQKAVVNAWGQGLAVSAGAGSGKTTTLTLKCFELLRRNPQARLCAVSFTERSASDLRLKLGTLLASEGRSLLGEGGKTSGHWVMTIHGLCGAVLREFPREAGFEGDEAVLSDTEAAVLWSGACETLWSDGLPTGVQESLDRLLVRENRAQILELLGRIRGLPHEQLARSLLASADPAAIDLVVVAMEVLGRYQKAKRRALAIDFEDLERGADRALEQEAVRLAFHRRFDLVLIDECQDTNPTQASILLRLARPDRSNLCVVGDAKQSIYRFRDADVTAFERLCQELPVRLSLTWNFRSRPPIIDYVNQICEPLFAASGLTYEALVPKKTPLPAGQSSVEQVELSEGPEQLAHWIRQQQAAGVPLEHMALLLRQIRGRGTRWVKALSQAGIPLAIGSGGFFWQDPRVLELVSFLKTWENPQNTLSLATFLRAPWMGLSDSFLDPILGSNLASRGQDLWSAFLATDHWASPLLRSLEAKRGSVRPGELLEALMGAAPVATENELGPAWLGLWHRAEDLASDGKNFRTITQEFADAIEKQRKSRDVPPPRNLGQLNVLTIHSSKGLEFPQVILVDFPVKPAANPDAPLLFWLPHSVGARLGVRNAEGERDKEAEAEWRKEELERNLAEQKRLFYVALTRAQEKLILVTEAAPDPVVDAAPKKSKKPPASPLELDHWREWLREGESQLQSRVTVDGSHSPPPLNSLPSRDAPLEESIVRARSAPVQAQRPRHSVTEWLNLSRCERAYEWTFVRPRVPVDGVPTSVRQQKRSRMTNQAEGWATEALTAAELGTEVHRLLEVGDLSGIDRLEAEVGSERLNGAALKNWFQTSAVMAPSMADAREVWKELAFEIWIDGQSWVGALDRVTCENRERYEVVDFKVLSRWKEAAELISSYRVQLQLYAFALGQLDPQARGKTHARLVAMTPTKIEEIPVLLPDYAQLETRARALARRAHEIVNGASGVPAPGKACSHCDFQSLCSEGQSFVDGKFNLS